MTIDPSTLRALIFDKDGTLFDFDATWSVWAGQMIRTLADGDAQLANQLAQAMKYDLDRAQYAPDSPVIAGTLREQAALLLPFLPGQSVDSLTLDMSNMAQDVPQVPVTPLRPLFQTMRDLGLALGVATNDSHASMLRHLDVAEVADQFDFLAGFDTGHGAKPGPGQLHAFAAHIDIPVSQIAMVGDSSHDLLAAKAAGMVGIGVLTGIAEHDDLAPFADVVLPSIADIPAWIGGDL